MYSTRVENATYNRRKFSLTQEFVDYM